MDAANIKRIWSISDRLASLRPTVAAETLRSSRGSTCTSIKQGHEHTSEVHRDRIKNILLKQDAVAEALVLCQQGPGVAGDDSFEAYITIHTSRDELGPDDGHKSTPDGKDDQHEEQRVEFWSDYWNELVYSAMGKMDLGSIGRDFLGWTSLYDGKEIDKTEMNEWLDETIASILDLCNPGKSHVLEIGTGSGMILLNIVNKVQSYVGLEMSPAAVSFVEEIVDFNQHLVGKVHMLRGTAAELGSLSMPTAPDLVIVNSVAQYFPTRRYLLSVIESIGAIPSVRTAFFGDIRSLPLHGEFLFTKAVHDLGDKATAQEVQSAISKSAQREMELLIDPGFFTALPDRFNGLIKHVEILPKCMKASNELSRFRYGVVIHFDKQLDGLRPTDLTIQDVNAANGEHVDFVKEGLNTATLCQRLQASSSESMFVSNIPNTKTSVETYLLDAATGSEVPSDGEYDIQSAGWLATARMAAQRRPAMSTLDLLNVACSSGYKIAMSAARQFSQRGGTDAFFFRDHPDVNDQPHGGAGKSSTRFRFPTDHHGRDWEAMTTHPMQLQARRATVEQLVETLQAELPVHLIPREIHVVEKLPVLDADPDHKHVFVHTRLF